jgi:hypothetical protein
MGKKLLWTALLTVATTLAARAAARGVLALWRAVAREEPPDVPFWGKLLVRRPLKSRVEGLLRAPM